MVDLKRVLLMIFCSFLLGVMLGSLLFPALHPGISERSSPADHVSVDQIHVYSSRVVIDLNNTRFSGFTDTNSMDPLLDSEHNGIETVPSSPDQISVGDIISYKHGKKIIIHRVVKISNDEKGWYCKTQGDNNQLPDPEKVRYNQVVGILVAIIY